MADIPQSVGVDDSEVSALVKLFKGAYKEIVGEISGASSFGVANRKAILKQIDQILVDLGVNVNDFVKSELPDYYKAGANDAVQQLDAIGAEIPVATGFNTVHKQAVAALVNDTTTSLTDAINGVKRSAMLLLNKEFHAELQQAIASGIIKGSTVDEAAKAIKATLQESGLPALIDRAGKKWSLDTYSEMLYRTKVAEARNMGLANRMLENGYDLVQVSNHFSLHRECAVWEDQILSLTGDTPGYPTLQEAQDAGLFHPNCEHAINALEPDLAVETEAYNPDTGDYEAGGGLDRSPQNPITK